MNVQPLPFSPRRSLAALRQRLRYGPPRPDLLLREVGSDLVVLSCRPKPEWSQTAAFAVGLRFFRLLRTEERPDRGFRSVAYLLAEAGPFWRATLA